MGQTLSFINQVLVTTVTILDTLRKASEFGKSTPRPSKDLTLSIGRRRNAIRIVRHASVIVIRGCTESIEK